MHRPPDRPLTFSTHQNVGKYFLNLLHRNVENFINFLTGTLTKDSAEAKELLSMVEVRALYIKEEELRVAFQPMLKGQELPIEVCVC